MFKKLYEKITSFYYMYMTVANNYLICERSNVILEAEGLRFLVKFRMVDGWLINVPEELIDLLLLDKVCLVSSVGGQLCGMNQTYRSQK